MRRARLTSLIRLLRAVVGIAIRQFDGIGSCFRQPRSYHGAGRTDIPIGIVRGRAAAHCLINASINWHDIANALMFSGTARNCDASGLLIAVSAA
jgi:hypothetical protein